MLASAYSAELASYQARVRHGQSMSVEVEVATVSALRAAERGVRGALLGTGFLARRTVAVLDDILAGKERWDRWLIPGPKECGDEKRTAWVAQRKHLGHLVEQCSLLSDGIWSGRLKPGALKPWRVQLEACLGGLPFRYVFFSDLLNCSQMASLRGERKFHREAWMASGEFEERVDLAMRYSADANRLRNRLVEAHLWLVPLVVRNYACQFLSHMDLVQEGNLGLVKAADHCLENQTSRFCSYASWWIRQAVNRAIDDKERLIRVPVSTLRNASMLRRVRTAMEGDNGKVMSHDDLAWHTQLSPERVRRILNAECWTVSIHQKADGGDGGELLDLIPDASAEDVGEAAGARDIQDCLQSALTILNERERWVIEQRFGLFGCEARSCNDLGAELGLTRQRVLMIEVKALKKLRHPSRLRLLSEIGLGK